MTEYLIFFAIVFGVNLLPAFGPPTWSIIALYTLSGDLALPILVPVGALAAGLARMRLLPFTAAFFAGRFVSYTIYGVTAHTIRATSLGEVVRSGLTSPWGIALQVAMLAGIVALTRIDWRKRLGGGDAPEG